MAGFRGRRGIRGISVTLLPDPRGAFAALVEAEYGGPQAGSVAQLSPRVLEPEGRTAVRLAILRQDLGATTVDVGDVSGTPPGPPTTRVVRIEREGIDVAARFTCEVEALP